METEVVDKYRIKGLESGPDKIHMTVIHDSINKNKNEFRNSYSQNLVLMNQNYNNPKMDFNASDAFLDQYATVFSKDKPLGTFEETLPKSPPKEIIRHGVVNDITRDIINNEVRKKNFKPNQKLIYEKKNEFFILLLDTPNVKSTNHMLNDFNTINRNRELTDLQYEIKKLTVVMGGTPDDAFNIIIETGQK